MCNIVFIRHGKTEGNSKDRYIGITDEPIMETSAAELKCRKYPPADILFVSPLIRCVQTAQIIYPDMEMIKVNDLRECDFGLFENKNYLEMSGLKEYDEWVASQGKAPVPGGEDPEEFSARCVRAFKDTLAEYGGMGTLAFVVHGGTIMAIMERLASPYREFYKWRVKNGGGYSVKADDDLTLTVISEF